MSPSIHWSIKTNNMSTGYRLRAYPDRTVGGVLMRWIGSQRFIKNAKVREDRYHRTFQRRFPEFAGQHAPVDQAYAHLIGQGNPAPGAGERAEADTSWLREVPSHVLRNGAVRFYQAYQRFFKGLARRPTITLRHGEQSAWLTSELFRFEPVVDDDGVATRYRLHIGTKKFPCGELPFVVPKGRERDEKGRRRPMRFEPAASIHVSVNAGRWHVSFSNEAAQGDVVPCEQDTLDQLRSFTAQDLTAKTIGLDRGVAVPLMAAGKKGETGEARAFDLLPLQRERMAKKARARARWQRRAARRVKGSSNRRKAINAPRALACTRPTCVPTLRTRPAELWSTGQAFCSSSRRCRSKA
jgi:putative transposase